MTAGDGLAAADVGAFVLAWTAAGSLEEVPALGWAACWACAAWEPAKVNRMAVTAAATHIVTAVAAIAGPGLARIVLQRTRLIACENAATHVDSARRITRRR